MLLSFSFLRSLLLASTFGFALPLVVLGLMLGGFAVVQRVPVICSIGTTGTENLLRFLAVFGSGDALEGALVIALACGLVGALFDTYAFYQQNSLRDSS
jgi:hypothetical protein